MLNYRNTPLHYSARFGAFDARGSHSKVKQTGERLSRSLGQIKELEKIKCELQMNFDTLQNRYNKLLKGSIQAMWEYCAQKSSDISHIPACDPHLTGMYFSWSDPPLNA